MLQISDLVKSFDQNSEPTLKKINLCLNEGEFCIVLGSNGSGKSTLFKCISGEYFSDHGSIKIAGEPVEQKSVHERATLISTVTQDINAGTIPEMTLLENMALSCLRTQEKSYKFYARQVDRIEKCLKELGLGLEQYLHQPLSCLSGGQRQVIATLMAFISKPKLLLLDEHTSALSPQTQQQLMDYTVRSIAELQITSLMITHQIKDALRYGDRLIVMHQGDIVLDCRGEAKQQLTETEIMTLC